MAFQLVAVGDCCWEVPPGKQRQVSDQIMQIRPDQVVLLGDVCQGQGGETAYRNWFDPTYGRLFDRPFAFTAIPGNHDRIADGESRPFRKRFLGNVNINNPTWFAQNLNKTWLLIALDDNARYIKEQTSWLRDVLRDNRRSASPRQIVIAWHAPRFTIGGTSITDNTRVHEWWKMLTNDPHTRVFLHGHQHSFRHKPTKDGKDRFVRDVFIVGTGGGDKYRPRNRYGVLVLNLFDGGGFKASYRQIYKNYDQRIGGPKGAVTFTLERGPRRVQAVARPGSGTSPTPEVSVPPPPPPQPPASRPDNPPPPKPPPSSIKPPRPPKDPTKRESYIEDDVLYIWG